VHFHIYVVDGVFEVVGDANDGNEGSKVKFHALANLSADAIAQVQNAGKRRIVRAFVKRGLLDSIDSKVMLLARHGGGFRSMPAFASPTMIERGWNDDFRFRKLVRPSPRPYREKRNEDRNAKCGQQTIVSVGHWPDYGTGNRQS
jgi:hypothetical protein